MDFFFYFPLFGGFLFIFLFLVAGHWVVLFRYDSNVGVYENKKEENRIPAFHSKTNDKPAGHSFSDSPAHSTIDGLDEGERP